MKRKISNSIMVFAILLIVFSGVMAVGNMKGWFDHGKSADHFTVEEQNGYAAIERNGVSYSLDKGTVLRAGDQIETLTDSSLQLGIEDNATVIAVNQETAFIVETCKKDSLSITITKGECYIAKTADDIELAVTLGDKKVICNKNKEETVLSIDVQEGSKSVHVMEGGISVSDSSQILEVPCGNTYLFLNQKNVKNQESMEMLTAASLDDFVLEHALDNCQQKGFIFTKDEITAVLEERKQEQTSKNEALLTIKKDEGRQKSDKDGKKGKESKISESDAKTNENPNVSVNPETKPSHSGKNINSETVSPRSNTNTNQNSNTSISPSSNQNTRQKKKRQTPKNTAKPDGSKEPQITPEQNQNKDTDGSAEKDKKVYTCTIAINCDSILNHEENLKSSKSRYVPQDGCILSTTRVEFTEGETVYDILKRACDKLDIQLEASYTPIYKSYYVEGIHNLYEFDCGSQSGWMYKVNGWYPNYSCSAYKLKDGDTIVWNYTCEGLGDDIS